MKLSVAKGFAIAALCVSAYAKAGVITIEPDDYALGTVLLPTPYASISYLYHDAGADAFSYRAAIVTIEPTCLLYDPCYAPTGKNVLSDGTLINGVLTPTGTVGLDAMYRGLSPGTPSGGAKLDSELISKWSEFRAMRVDFAEPTDYFSADFYGVTDPINIFAFSSDGTFLSFTSNGYDGDRATRRTAGPCEPVTDRCSVWEQTLSVEHDTRDIGFVIYGSQSSLQRPDAVRFSIPEPSMLALCSAGLFAVLGFRRKRPNAVQFKSF